LRAAAVSIWLVETATSNIPVIVKILVRIFVSIERCAERKKAATLLSRPSVLDARNRRGQRALRLAATPVAWESPVRGSVHRDIGARGLRIEHAIASSCRTSVRWRKPRSSAADRGQPSGSMQVCELCPFALGPENQRGLVRNCGGAPQRARRQTETTPSSFVQSDLS
jgi:hypothetical protein